MSNASVADVIVRMEIQQGAVIDNVDFRLYDGEAPVTVTNFINYVNDGDYDQSFIHRSAPGFVVQGGGFIFDQSINDGTFSNDPLINDYPGGLQPVPTDPPIVNEFSRSNTRGTISMAKLAGDPDSATSQWFINLVDNSASLDIDNGGYTVFGDVLDDGMTIIDTMANQPIFDRTNIHSAFDTLPLVDYMPVDSIENSNLVKINTITELFTITPDIDYGTVTSGSNVQPEITIKNTGSEPLKIGAIGDANPVVDPFSIFDGRCANSIIPSGDQCSFMVLFSPESEGTYVDSFNIEIANYGISHEVSLNGVGGPAVDEPDILVSFTSVDYGVVNVLDSVTAPPYTFSQIVQNTGNLDLTISSIDVAGADAAEVEISGNCIGLGALQPGGFCSLSIEFRPVVPGDKYAEISIITDDHDENPFIIPVRATVAETVAFSITPEIDYGTVTSGSSVQPEVTIENLGNEPLQIGAIADTDPVAEPFAIVDGKCANSVIQPGDQCSFMVLFSPEAEETYTDSFNIEVIDYSVSYEVILTGVGGPAVDEPDILVSFTSVDYGVVDVLYSESALPYEFPQLVQNSGNQDLTISSIEVGGIDAGDISLSGSCFDTDVLGPGSRCSLSIEFKPLIPGDKYAEISIITDDPDENPFIISVRGTAAPEDDGVPADIEDAGPNNGDGNIDDILDSRQSNVATLVDSYGHYVTYLTTSNLRFNGMTALQESEVDAMPLDVVIGSGIHDFGVQNALPGQLIEIGVILPANVVPSDYYMYGPTSDNPSPHWYKFNFDGETGAVILNGVVFTTSDGRALARNVLKIFIKDGGRGDADMTVDGVVTVTGGMPVTISSDGGSGSVGILLLLFTGMFMFMARGRIYVRQFCRNAH